jgi:hypothetical protein
MFLFLSKAVTPKGQKRSGQWRGNLKAASMARLAVVLHESAWKDKSLVPY